MRGAGGRVQSHRICIRSKHRSRQEIMKLRIRSARGGSTFKLEVPATCSLQALRDAIRESLESKGIPFSQPIGVSLNKVEVIEGHGSALLSQFGIRSGDLLFYFESGGLDRTMEGGQSAGEFGVSNFLRANARVSGAAENRDGVSEASENRARDLEAEGYGRRVLEAAQKSATVDVAAQDPSRVSGETQPRSRVSAAADTADGVMANIRRELCAAAATRRATSAVQSFIGAVRVASSPSGAATLMDEPGALTDVAYTSMEIQTDGENLPDDIPIDGVDASPMQVSNSIPAILQRVLMAEHSNVSRLNDLLVLAIHAVMLETGFIVLNAVVEGYTLPMGWSSSGTVNLHYTLGEIGDASNDVGHVILRSQTLGNTVVMYGTITTGSPPPVFRLSMRTRKYLTGNILSCDDLISLFSDLFGLWKCAKDELSLPLLTILCERAGLPSPSSLLVVPMELKMKILECLPALDLAKVGCTCSELRHLSANDEIWKRLFLEEFGSSSAGQQLPGFRGWKAAYQQRFLERKRVLDRRVHPQRPLHGISSRFAPRFPRMGGIIGGDYDIYPSFGSGPFRGGLGGTRGPLGDLHGRLRGEGMDAPGTHKGPFSE